MIIKMIWIKIISFNSKIKTKINTKYTIKTKYRIFFFKRIKKIILKVN